MGSYNLLHVDFRCPSCGKRTVGSVEFRFGCPNFSHYTIGESIVGFTEEPLEGEGFTQCPKCSAAVIFVIIIQDTVIHEVLIDFDTTAQWNPHPVVGADPRGKKWKILPADVTSTRYVQQPTTKTTKPPRRRVKIRSRQRKRHHKSKKQL